LNPVPIRLVHDRWVSKYAEPWAATLSGIKTRLEEENMERIDEAGVRIEGTNAVYEIFIKTTPERLWEAITDPKLRARYSFGVETHSDWTPGSSYESSVLGVIDIAAGENIEVEPPRRL